jgi:diguanylate cyclase (GGDEF)-like protein
LIKSGREEDARTHPTPDAGGEPGGRDTSITPVVQHEPKGVRTGKGEACLVVIYGPELGRRIPLSAATFAVGRSSKSDLTLDQESVSRNHARITRARREGADAAYVVADLGSTNGTYVNDVSVTERELWDGDQIKIGRSILKFMSGDNIETSYHEEIYRLMTVDGLTQIFNKRYFTETLEREVNRSTRYERPLSLVLIDIDFFKKKNDELGHVAGDALLKQIASAVKPKLRSQDIFARVGGEEFGVLLPEVAAVGARVTAEKIRQLVEETEFTFDALVVRCTISLGVAELGPDVGSGDALYKAADDALYTAKKAGRNQVAG